MNADNDRDLHADLLVCGAAAPGPWYVVSNDLTFDDPGYWCIVVRGADYEVPAHCYGSKYRQVNAAFIAAAREGWPAALRRLTALEAAVRRHRDYRGDDRCYLDNRELYAVLPEGYTPPAEDTDVELENCKRFIASMHDPATVYTSPQRRIEQLEAENAALRLELSSRGGACPSTTSTWAAGRTG